MQAASSWVFRVVCVFMEYTWSGRAVMAVSSRCILGGFADLRSGFVGLSPLLCFAI